LSKTVYVHCQNNKSFLAVSGHVLELIMCPLPIMFPAWWLATACLPSPSYHAAAIHRLHVGSVMRKTLSRLLPEWSLPHFYFNPIWSGCTVPTVMVCQS